MDLTTIKEAFNTLKNLPNLSVNSYKGGIYLYSKNKKFQTIINFNYSDSRPIYYFHSISLKIKFFEVENMLTKLIVKYLNRGKFDEKFISTFEVGKFFSRAARFQGVENSNELNDFIEEVDKEIKNFIIPALLENNTLEKVGERIKTMSQENYLKYLGGQESLFRRIIIMDLLGETDFRNQYILEANQFFQADLEADPESQDYLNILHHLTNKINNQEYF